MPTPQSDLFKVRLEKLQRLRDKGVNPYPHRFNRTHTVIEAIMGFESSENKPGDQEADEVAVVLAGRILAIRSMGKASFVDILDGTGRVQSLLRKNDLGDSYNLIEDLDIGDWIGIHGPLFRTRTGEITVRGQHLTLLCKSLRPLPEKWHGLTDTEIRYRQRYLDLISNEEAKRVALLRSHTIKAIRRFMDERGFIEVETPTLVPVAAGAMAHPFSTNHKALNRQLYLRIATELYLKKLIVGGIEKVFEIGKVFRNEGIDLHHNPEFTTLESYETYADYSDIMQMVELMVSDVCRDVTGSTQIGSGEQIIDFTPPWPRLSLHEEIKRHSGIDFFEHASIDSLREVMNQTGIDTSGQSSWGGLVDKIVSSKVEPQLIQPTFLVDYPVEMSPLAKKHRTDSRLAERFEGFVAGMEICNAFTELNDPVDQRLRFEEQEELRLHFENEETDRLDEDFLIAVEHGMPPTGGLGIGIDRLVMLLSGQRTIREVILFPQLRSL